MNLFIQSCDAGGDINPIIAETLLGFLPRVDSIRTADAVVVPICYVDHYRFNRALLSIDKPIIILDFLEFGWDAGDKPNILGTGAVPQFGHLNSPEWALLDTWVGSKQTITFKRELFEKDRTHMRLPVEFPCRLPIPEVQTKEQFEDRDIEVFHCWGLSHPARQSFHGEIFRNAHTYGIHVVDAWNQDVQIKTWATIHVPHYNRKPISEVMEWNQKAKISVSLPGAGVKCFRSSEAPVGSIMAMYAYGPDDDERSELAWSIPWIDGHNCIRLRESLEFETLLNCVRSADLYPIYRQSQETIAKYQSQRYVNEYILPAIAERL